MRLFFFGSLLDPDLFALVVGRPLAAFDHAPAAAGGWARHRARGEDYPILVPRPDAWVSGRVVAGFTAEELDRCDFFEGGDYAAEPLSVRVAGPGPFGHGPCPAHAYFSTGTLADADEPWSLADWQAREKPLAMLRADEFMALYGVASRAEADARWDEIKVRAAARYDGRRTAAPRS